MEKFICKFKNALMLTFAVLVAVFFCLTTNSYSINKTIANNVEHEPQQLSTLSNHSMFIHSPTYSVLYNKDIYFIDDYDKLLKKYISNDEKFDTNYIDLNSIGTISTVSNLDNLIFIISSKSSNLYLNIVNLSNFELEKQILLENLSVDYNQISICLSNSKYLISLTPANYESQPYIITLNSSSLEIENKCELILDDSILQTLFKVIIINSTGTTNNEIYLSLIYNDEISFFGTQLSSITTLESFELDLTKNSLSEKLDTTNSNISYASANTIYINDKTLFLITYTENNSTLTGTELSSSSKLYEFEIDVSDNNKYFDSKLSIQTHSQNYILTSDSCLIYPLIENQQICCTKIAYNSSTARYSDTTLSPITNPSVEIKYYNESNFEYMTVNKITNILSTPWESVSSSTYKIDPTNSAKDIVVIGYGEISSENLIVSDYKYCLFTSNDKNIKGFVKCEDLSAKPKINVSEYEYKVFKVQPNTNLYSFPTTITNNQITPTLSSTIVHEIEENSRVELIDTICRYNCNEKIMLKVKVNNQYYGYIEYDKIIKPSDKLNFVITNASIKDDNTIIYLKSNSTSQIICTLEKGYRVRINGSRNTNSGFTSVTFNDEFGNEFSGYILTDSISSDSWTNLQIIGCILIAINIGLLILIIRFKHKHIGFNGSKYIDNKK